MPAEPSGEQAQSGWLRVGSNDRVHRHGFREHHIGGGHDAGVGVVDGEAHGFAQVGQGDGALLADGHVRGHDCEVPGPFHKLGVAEAVGDLQIDLVRARGQGRQGRLPGGEEAVSRVQADRGPCAFILAELPLIVGSHAQGQAAHPHSQGIGDVVNDLIGQGLGIDHQLVHGAGKGVAAPGTAQLDGILGAEGDVAIRDLSAQCAVDEEGPFAAL